MRPKWHSGNTTVTFTRFLFMSSTFLLLVGRFKSDQGAFKTAQHPYHLEQRSGSGLLQARRQAQEENAGMMCYGFLARLVQHLEKAWPR